MKEHMYIGNLLTLRHSSRTVAKYSAVFVIHWVMVCSLFRKKPSTICSVGVNIFIWKHWIYVIFYRHTCTYRYSSGTVKHSSAAAIFHWVIWVELQKVNFPWNKTYSEGNILIWYFTNSTWNTIWSIQELQSNRLCWVHWQVFKLHERWESKYIFRYCATT